VDDLKQSIKRVEKIRFNVAFLFGILAGAVLILFGFFARRVTAKRAGAGLFVVALAGLFFWPKASVTSQTSDHKIVVRLGTTGESWAREHLPDVPRVTLDSDAACVLEVVNGSVDAWVYDQISIMNFHARHPDTTRANLAVIREEVWAAGLRKGDDDLRVKINEVLAKMKADGSFTALAEKHLAKERAMMQAQNLPFVFE
jgi:ABC-type amino acid transport substrate-binding protein